MLTRSHTSAAAFIGMASLLPFHGARAAAISPEDTPVTCIAEHHDFTLKDLRGKYVFVHFLPAGDPAAQADHVRSFVEGARSLAGVHNLFIRCDDQAAVSALAGRFKARGAEFAFDRDCRLLAEFKLDKGAVHTVIALDPDGRELFRTTEPGGAAPSFAALRARFDRAWTAPARGEYNLPKGSTVAVQGYDVVSYFVDGKAAKGRDEFIAEYRGVGYRFAASDHRDAFVADPQKYLPTYGGWCASAMGDGGRKVEIDPTNFKVKDGRLFLFYKSIFANALTDWNKHEKEWEPAADGYWEKLTGEKAATASR